MNIVEDENTGEIIIDGIRIKGHIDALKRQYCNSFEVYYDKYDAYFCPQCNLWLEKKCKNSDCEYCNKRPENPL